jgi:hypothetical protein
MEGSTPDEATAEPTEEQVRELEAENERLRSTLATTRRRGRVWRRVRGILVWVLVVLTSVGVLATTTAFWAQRTVFDTDKYVALVTPVIDDPAVQNQVAARLTAQVVQALDLEGRVQAILPSELQALAGPLTSQVQSFLQKRIHAFVASDAFRSVWVEANTVAHQKIVALLKGDMAQLPNVVITSGEVRINLLGAVARVLQSLGQDLVNLVGVSVTIPDFPAETDPQQAIDRLSTILGGRCRPTSVRSRS